MTHCCMSLSQCHLILMQLFPRPKEITWMSRALRSLLPRLTAWNSRRASVYLHMTMTGFSRCVRSLGMTISINLTMSRRLRVLRPSSDVRHLNQSLPLPAPNIPGLPSGVSFYTGTLLPAPEITNGKLVRGSRRASAKGPAIARQCSAEQADPKQVPPAGPYTHPLHARCKPKLTITKPRAYPC